MSKRVHDADLCERIRELEDEVKRLRDEVATMPHHHCYHYYPYWTTSPWYPTYPTVIYDNGTSSTYTISTNTTTTS